ncbi:MULTISPECIES: YbjQ family protein [unclassified Crossiella]|uniref:YbjQ family protein n=1 Tax=unclassified Crossiella TaxID=2620835 RepID=UPI001FFF5306|nr:MULTISPECIES: YbjQ family protein [unclassified Crossiella]MCK2236712.1 YbjQ family protein [Crossiella sp. S99.2]MCK2250380.1 YbjQ family protein [Crossiella sp. S99.1]
MGHPMQPQQPPPILVSTMNDVPGYRIVQVFGEVFGLTVRSRNAFSDIGASFKGMFGGEQVGYTKLLSDSRWEAINRMRAEAAQRGANAVIAMRFESGEVVPGSTEIAAYGTAVFIVPEQQQPPQQ